MSDPTRLKNNIKVNRLLRRRCHSTRARRNLSVDRLLEADDTQSSPQALETIWRQAALILNAPGGRVPPIVPGGSTPRGRWRSSSKAQFSLLLKHARTQPQNDWCDLSRFSQAVASRRTALDQTPARCFTFALLSIVRKNNACSPNLFSH